ncbi:conserved hypothetical protein [Culex quinquefasciatus]|uniref:Uncharacterized protein n=1 Tax=Culex quinquefasciatus TaxID=7176 RepID=B0W0W8_CULQU|nr:conserved hypothetical protein [Culex quinquefasciatus]|eukprot:XP_001842352.1 conserved hypothetical protein [Culex quinquefasciatus]
MQNDSQQHGNRLFRPLPSQPQTKGRGLGIRYFLMVDFFNRMRENFHCILNSLEIKRQRYASCRNPVSTFSPSTTMKSFDSHNRRAPGCLTLLFNREIPTALQAVPQSSRRMGLICRSISSGGHKCLMPGISLPSQDIRPHGRKSIPHRRPRWTRKDAGFMRVVGGAGRSASGRRKKEQQARISLRSPIFNLQSSVFSLQSSVFSLQSSVFSLPSSVFSLQSSVFSLPSSVFSLQSSVFSLPSSVFSLPSSVFSLQSSVFSLQSSVFSLPSSVFRLPSSVFSLQSSVFSLQSSVFNLQSSVFSLQSSVFSLQSSVFSLPYSVFSLQSSVFSLQSSVFSLQSSVFRLPSSVFRLPSSVFRLPSSVFSLPSSVFSLQSSVFNLQSSVFSLQSSVFSLQSSVFSLPSSVFRLPSSVFRLPSSVFRLPSSVFRLPSSVFSLQSSVFSLPSSVFSLQSSVFSLQSSVFSLQSSVFRLPSSVFRLPSSVFSLPSSVFRLQSSILQTSVFIFRFQVFTPQSSSVLTFKPSPIAPILPPRGPPSTPLNNNDNDVLGKCEKSLFSHEPSGKDFSSEQKPINSEGCAPRRGEPCRSTRKRWFLQEGVLSSKGSIPEKVALVDLGEDFTPRPFFLGVVLVGKCYEKGFLPPHICTKHTHSRLLPFPSSWDYNRTSSSSYSPSSYLDALRPHLCELKPKPGKSFRGFHLPDPEIEASLECFFSKEANFGAAVNLQHFLAAVPNFEVRTSISIKMAQVREVVIKGGVHGVKESRLEASRPLGDETLNQVESG